MQIGNRLDSLVIHLGDTVARFDARLFSRAAGTDFKHQHATALRDAEVLRQLFGEVVGGDAETRPAAHEVEIQFRHANLGDVDAGKLKLAHLPAGKTSFQFHIQCLDRTRPVDLYRDASARRRFLDHAAELGHAAHALSVKLKDNV